MGMVKNTAVTALNSLPGKIKNKILRASDLASLVLRDDLHVSSSIRQRERGEFEKWVEQDKRGVALNKEVLGRIVDSYISAKKEQIPVKEAYLPAETWARLLDENWRPFNDAISNRRIDEAADYLSGFFRNEYLSGIWGGQDNFGHFKNLDAVGQANNFARFRQKHLTWRSFLPDTPLSELDIPLIGQPWGYRINEINLHLLSHEYHYEAYNLARLVKDHPRPVVLEIGGGFGGLAYYLKRNNQDITYVGLDLPENIALQTYYLSHSFPESRILTFSGEMEKSIDLETLKIYDFILLPNFCISWFPEESVEVIVNINSFSEMSMATIVEYFKYIDVIGGLYLYHQNLFTGRLDGHYGIPMQEFPELQNFRTVFEANNRWQDEIRSSYKTRENLLIRIDKLKP